MTTHSQNHKYMTPNVRAFFDEYTYTASYVAFDPDTHKCAIIDSVLNFDPSSGRTSTESADILAEFIRNKKLAVCWILEAHVHADHLTAPPIQKKSWEEKLPLEIK